LKNQVEETKYKFCCLPIERQSADWCSVVLFGQQKYYNGSNIFFAKETLRCAWSSDCL